MSRASVAVLRLALASCCGLALAGCTNVVTGMTETLASDLTAAMLDNDDLEVVRNGAPAYLIMLDALLRSNADSPALLQAAASLNAAYGSAFADDPDQARNFADKALRLASRAACAEVPWTCEARTMPFAELRGAVADVARGACAGRLHLSRRRGPGGFKHTARIGTRWRSSAG